MCRHPAAVTQSLPTVEQIKEGKIIFTSSASRSQLFVSVIHRIQLFNSLSGDISLHVVLSQVFRHSRFRLPERGLRNACWERSRARHVNCSFICSATVALRFGAARYKL